MDYDSTPRSTTLGRVGGGSINSTEAAPSSSTERETIALHESVSEMAKIVQRLAERLHPVLRQSSPQVGAGTDNKEESLPPLANAVRQSRYVLRGSIYQLEDVLGRLDI